MFLNYRACARHPFFLLLRSYSLLTQKVSFISDFSRTFSLRFADPRPMPRATWRLVSFLPALFFSLCFGLEIEIFFRTPCISRWLPSDKTPTQFPWHFHYLLFTIRHRCILFWYQRNLRVLLKVNYLTISTLLGYSMPRSLYEHIKYIWFINR